MRKRKSLPQPPDDHQKGFVSIVAPMRAAGARISLSRRVSSLIVAALLFLAAAVVELALVPATASAAPNPVTTHVTPRGSDPGDADPGAHQTPWQAAHHRLQPGHPAEHHG
jgi:hypothetical protein